MSRDPEAAGLHGACMLSDGANIQDTEMNKTWALFFFFSPPSAQKLAEESDV